ncbi:hypothetical protein IT568_01590 [bacterium]|nr:hypothetical protein [bacterium]
MKKINFLLFLLLFGCNEKFSCFHKLKVKIEPEKSFAEVSDKITFGNFKPNFPLFFVLNENLQIKKITSQKNEIEFSYVSKSVGDSLKKKWEISSDEPLAFYVIEKSQLTKFSNEIILFFSGKLEDKKAIEKSSASNGIIDSQGGYFGGETYWIPYFDDSKFGFELEVDLPKPYKTVSQGVRISENHWLCTDPTDTIYLIFGKYFFREKDFKGVKIQTFLYNENEAELSDKLMSYAKKYLELYDKKFGKYPYSKFATVEFFLQTGWGMPSFTLIGDKIIRQDFFFEASFGHEILHNWWGNSVFVDHKFGNWCEGLTTFGADYFYKESEGKGKDYRKNILKNYTVFVKDSSDFPIKNFVSNSGSVSQTIGYEKTLMVLEDLQKLVGKGNLDEALKKFYKDFRFKNASMLDLYKEIEKQSGKDLREHFQKWICEVGAIDFELFQEGKKIKLIQKNLFNFNLPIEVNGKKRLVKITEKETVLDFDSLKTESTVKIDPDFEIFRKLKNDEIPVSIDLFYENKRKLIVLPDKSENFEAYSELANKFKNFDKISASELTSEVLNSYGSVLVLGNFGENSVFAKLEKTKTSEEKLEFENRILKLGKETKDLNDKFCVLVEAISGTSQKIIYGFGTSKEGIEKAGYKIQYYGKFSELAFEKGQVKIKEVLENQTKTMIFRVKN